MGRQPGEPVGLGGQLDDLERSDRPQRAAVGLQHAARPLSCSSTSATTRSFAVAVVRARRRFRAAARALREAPVVGPEVVPPVGDAVRLVDHQQPEAVGEQRQHRVAERGLLSRSGVISSRSTASASSSAAHLVPRVAVGRVDRVRADPSRSPPRSGCASAPAAARRSASDRRRAHAASRSRGSRRPISPARALHAQHAARGPRRGRSRPRAGAREAPRAGPASRFRSSWARSIPGL